MSTVIVIDARSRKLETVFVASATRDSDDPENIILRKAGNVGSVKDLIGRTLEYPVFVVGSYQAKSSAGFVEPLYSGYVFYRMTWIGGAGFGFSSKDKETGKQIHRGFGLRPFGRPLSGVLIPVGAKVSRMESHRNSNPDTADAALVGFKLLTELNPWVLVLAEGQSDYTNGYSFEVPTDAEIPQLPVEHRSGDIFSSEKMIEAGIRRIVGNEEGKEGRIALRYAVLNSVLAIDGDVERANRLMPCLPRVFSTLIRREGVKAVVEKRYAELIEVGWKFGFDMSLGNHFTRASSPEAIETSGNALFPDKEVEEHFLRLSNYNTLEEKEQMRIHEISNSLSNYFWGKWAVNFPSSSSSHNFLVEAEFGNGEESTRLWFSNSDIAGPNGEPSNGYRFLDAFDCWKTRSHLWSKLLDLKKITVTAYKDGNSVNSLVWLAEKSDCPYILG